MVTATEDRLHGVPPTPPPPATHADGTLGIVELLSDLRDETSLLLRKEGELARAEVRQSVERVTKNLAKIALASILAVAGTVLLLHAAGEGMQALLYVLGVDAEIAIWLGPLVLGLLVTAVAVALLMSAIKKLSHVEPVPHRTVETLKDNAEFVKEKVTR